MTKKKARTLRQSENHKIQAIGVTSIDPSKVFKDVLITKTFKRFFYIACRYKIDYVKITVGI